MFIAKRISKENPEQGQSDGASETSIWQAPTAGKPLNASLKLPGSKSLTNRELVLAALAEGPGFIRAPLHSRDSELMVDALRALGTAIDEQASDSAFGNDWQVTPPTELLGSTSISCGLAGTVMRFMPPVAALALGPTSFDGDAAARRRPMRAMLNALRDLGADISDEGRGALPFTVHGTGQLRGGRVELDASLSSQFVSGLLLAGARFTEGVHIVHTGERLPSLPHIEMTVQALRGRGVTVETPAVGEWSVAPGPISAADVVIEPDLSNAAPFLAAALVAGGRVSIQGWPSHTTQVGDRLRALLGDFGANVVLEADTLTISAGTKISGVQLNLADAGELAPTLVGLAALASGPSEIVGIGHIRHHETDRLAALVSEINRLGGSATELEDGIRIDPRPLHGGIWRTYEDHRMATTGALIGLAVADIDIENIETTSKTLPQFPELWKGMLDS